MATDQPELPPDTDLNDFNYLAMSLEAEAALGQAYGYVSMDAIRFYLGQIRRVYQEAAAARNIVRLVFVERDGDQPA